MDVISVRVNEAQHAHLTWLAQAQGRTLSDVVRTAVDDLPWSVLEQQHPVVLPQLDPPRMPDAPVRYEAPAGRGAYVACAALLAVVLLGLTLLLLH